MFKNKYRVLRVQAAEHAPQVKFWWFPFIWFNMGDCNYYSRAAAKEYIINATGETKIL